MRVSAWLAWLLVGSGLFTAGLLRRYHDEIPESPYLHPTVGSLLFFAILVLLLVTAREQARGPVGGRGVRLGSLTPLLLMLLIEKWLALVTHAPVFAWLSSGGGSPAHADARFRAYAGAALILVCLLLARLSTPTARKTWRRARPARWPAAALQTLAIIAGVYLILGVTAWLLGGTLRLGWPRVQSLLWWVLVGQAVLAFGEELYYRGLLMNEMERLAPRLGMRGAPARRWTALLATSLLFALEHVDVSQSWNQLGRQAIFTAALGILFGLLVMVTANLHLAAGVHAWINWLLLGAAPHFVDDSGQSALPAGTYIGLTLVLAFVVAFARRRPAQRPPRPRAG